MTTKPNASPPIICGRPYVLFDPEQTAEIKRVEAKKDEIERVVNALRAAMAQIAHYEAPFGLDAMGYEVLRIMAQQALTNGGDAE